jgi:hypothetical protein
VDKAHKQPIAHTGQSQTSVIKTFSITKCSIDANLLQTQCKTSKEYKSQRGSGCSLLAHPLPGVMVLRS